MEDIIGKNQVGSKWEEKQHGKNIAIGVKTWGKIPWMSQKERIWIFFENNQFCVTDNLPWESKFLIIIPWYHITLFGRIFTPGRLVTQELLKIWESELLEKLPTLIQAFERKLVDFALHLGSFLPLQLWVFCMKKSTCFLCSKHHCSSTFSIC